MAKKPNPVEAAAERIGILREIVNRERQRTEANPNAPRYRDMGITELDQPQDEQLARIAAVFDELGYLIDHLNIAHMAASFEGAAMARLATVIGLSRGAIAKGRKGAGRWPVNLVRDMSSFEGLYDIAEVMALDAETQKMFKAIRGVRNRFGHASQIDAAPIVTGSETLETLSAMLAELQ